MSSHQSNPSLSRPRSLRVPAKALTAPQAPAAPITKPAQIPTCTSNVLLFLTNSRLLDLDVEPDWPDITPTTFSGKDAVGGQKKRIQCVEWALYQLFCLWDRNDAQNKLRPFYPPADQVQSINLRAALVRSLEAVKKNGVLGRDVIIRKTMLDECKGERLEEVLAVFSSAVLKKLVAERALNSGPEYRPTISENIALENWGYAGDRTELNGLLLAHKVSLKSMLEKKRAAREKYHDFKELLDMKERGIARRQGQVDSNTRNGDVDVPDAAKTEARRILRNNWTGNEQWVDGLLGDSSIQKGGLLNRPFDDVWSGVQEGSIADLEEQTAGLLEQLEQRVHHQQTRLQKWEDFRQSTFGDVRPRVSRDPPPKKKKDKARLDLTAHLKLDSDKLASSNGATFVKPPPEYTNLFDRLTKELEGLKKTKIPNFSSLVTGARRGPSRTISSQLIPQEEVLDPVSDLSDWEDESEEVIPEVKIEQPSISSNARPTAIPRGFAGSRRQLPVPQEHRRTSPVRREDASRAGPASSQAKHKTNAIDDEELGSTSRYEDIRGPHPLPDQPRPVARTNSLMPPPSRPKSPTQTLADEILDSMNNASPSPMKKTRYTLSLAERTRMSMTRTTTFDPEDDSPQVSPVKASHPQLHDGLGANGDLEQGEEYEDLITRTRRSMVGFEAARQKAQVERRKSQRKSRIAQRKDNNFPRVDEDTAVDLSVVEGLMEESQEDYEAIFRSRPRIATSPAPSPIRQWYGEE
ncbi:hypothetical protein SAMD00023353_0800800 [Rosellinia necatrix]|uniref:HAUS augmin-like complex subunit 6 N-terminal domain-containing protein n=1 Tax=Rosellinia necatrix TaxID=77044 RepID=A0A1W2TAW8_ROSNE|nr:hypothetical protein SAMD00023353_0800800 [Rosellinia necatrix]